MRKIDEMISDVDDSCVDRFDSAMAEKNGERRFALLWPLAVDILEHFSSLGSQDRTGELINKLICHGGNIAYNILNPLQTPVDNSKDERIKELDALVLHLTAVRNRNENEIREFDNAVADLKKQVRSLKAKLARETKRREGK